MRNFKIGDLVTWTSMMGHQYIGIFNGWDARGKLKYKIAYSFKDRRILYYAGHINVYEENIRLSNESETEIYYHYEKRDRKTM